MVDVLLGLIEYRIAACTKRPSGPTGRTCYHTRQIDTRQRTHSPYLFRLCARVRMPYVSVVVQSHNFQTSIRRQWERSWPQREKERVQRSSPFYYVNVMCIKLLVNLPLEPSADFRSWSARYRQRWLETSRMLFFIVIFFTL